MSERNTKRFSLEDIRRMKGQTDWARLREAGDHGGPSEFEIDWSRVSLEEPEPKQPISFRVDSDVLAFFKSQGKGYQTRMNAVLRSFMLANKHP
jgi:uncharacterized protein (DUF4415 family)